MKLTAWFWRICNPPMSKRGFEIPNSMRPDYKFARTSTFVFLVLTVLFCSCTQKQDPIDRLLSQMTIEEKCGQLSCPIGFNFYGKEGDSLWLANDFLGMMDTLPLGSCWAVLRADP